MKNKWITAGMACGLVAALVGCDNTGMDSTASTAQGTSVAGRTAFDSASVQVTDANGDTVGRAPVGHGGFVLHLPEGVRFPLLVVVDSAGFQLRSLVPDSNGQIITVNRLTDSACKHLGGATKPPRNMDRGVWNRQLDSLRPVVDTLLPPPASVNDSLKRWPFLRDTTKRLGPPDTLTPPPPQPPVKDTTKWTVCDSLKAWPFLGDSTKFASLCKDNGKIGPRDTLKPPPPPPFKDSGKIHKPHHDSGKVGPRDTLKPPPADTLKARHGKGLRPPLDTTKWTVQDSLKHWPFLRDTTKFIKHHKDTGKIGPQDTLKPPPVDTFVLPPVLPPVIDSAKWMDSLRHLNP